MKCEFRSNFNEKICLLSNLKEFKQSLNHWKLLCDDNKECMFKIIERKTNMMSIEALDTNIDELNKLITFACMVRDRLNEHKHSIIEHLNIDYQDAESVQQEPYFAAAVETIVYDALAEQDGAIFSLLLNASETVTNFAEGLNKEYRK